MSRNEWAGGWRGQAGRERRTFQAELEPHGQRLGRTTERQDELITWAMGVGPLHTKDTLARW